ncbi:hypothetical protein [Glaesserella sp.]|uniref:hypothetical protein n=1 Tax=Glaesserella sp. TaxID=2094731 RepID=UPI0035A14EA8
MEITLGDKIKINGEEVPEYLLKALHEVLKFRYLCLGENIINPAPIVTSTSILPNNVIR